MPRKYSYTLPGGREITGKHLGKNLF
uniref:Uncharacterized protein n=1 Tax=Anguilla anguilla TaxID=7936 RepID=A0A0E9QCY7_ANGAN